MALKTDFRHTDFASAASDALFMMRHVGSGRPATFPAYENSDELRCPHHGQVSRITPPPPQNQCPTDAAPFSPSSRPSANRSRPNGAISGGGLPAAIVAAIASPDTGPALNP